MMKVYARDVFAIKSHLQEMCSFVSGEIYFAGKEKQAGQKKTKSTQKRKGPANSKKDKVRKVVERHDSTSDHLHTSSVTDISQEAQLQRNQIPAESQQQHQPLPQFDQLRQNYGYQHTSGQSFFPPASEEPSQQQQGHPEQLFGHHQGMQPGFPEPPVAGYIVTLLKFCHRNVASCYGCRGRFFEQGYPSPPRDLVVVTKTRRWYKDPHTQQRVQSAVPSNVYFHFSKACINAFDAMFQPQMITAPKEVQPFLLPEHRNILLSCSLNI